MKRPGLFRTMLFVGMLGACATPQSQMPKAVTATHRSTPAATERTQAQVHKGLPPGVQRWLELSTQLGAQIFAAKRDCKRIATVVKDFTARHRAELAQVNRALIEWEQQVSRGAVDSFYTKARPHIDRRIDAAILCDGTTTARTAFDDFLKASGLDQR